MFRYSEYTCSHCGAMFTDTLIESGEDAILRHLRDVHGIVGTPRRVRGKKGSK